MANGMGVIAERLRARLEEGLSPSRLELEDESSRHAGHAGARETGESHFRVTVQSERFEGLSRIERQRLVHRLLADELAGPVHALAITALAPGD